MLSASTCKTLAPIFLLLSFICLCLYTGFTVPTITMPEKADAKLVAWAPLLATTSVVTAIHGAAFYACAN